MPANDPATLEAETGLVVLAMGKFGAFELNYSSDIDLVVFYDNDRFPFRKKDDARGAAVDLVKGLVKLLSETTADGYVFRVDLRLRPDAGATQVAISTAAAESYYEGHGAELGTRGVHQGARLHRRFDGRGRFPESAGAVRLAAQCLDYAAIEDIHSIKRQIHAHGKHGASPSPVTTSSSGRGGIREIEFFAQTQQLILGGRKSGAALVTHARRSRSAARTRSGDRGNRPRSGAGLSLPAPARAPPPDDRG